MELKLNGRTVVLADVAGVDFNDYPDFCDAYFEYAEYIDGTKLTDDELDQLGEMYPEVLNELAFDSYL